MNARESTGGRPRSNEVLLSEVRERTAWLTFNRPETLNAFNESLRRALAGAIRTAEANDEVAALVFCGAGGRSFSTGGDLKELVGCDLAETTSVPATDIFSSIAQCRKPTIAAIDGYCIAAGMEVATLCDIRLELRVQVSASPRSAVR